MVVFQKSLTTFAALLKSLFPDAEFDPFNFTKKKLPKRTALIDLKRSFLFC